MPGQLEELANAGQSIWLDNIRRSMFSSGELQRLIDAGLRGMTSNPTIFEKAIGAGNDYDEQLRELAAETDTVRVFEELAIRDIRGACDLFRPVWERSAGLDGYVSLEVPASLAHDTAGTIQAAQRLWKAVGRPNVMIKIPGTREGVPAIRAAVAAGININVTLLFSIDAYEAAATAYIEGLEDRVARGEPVDAQASVASVFVSRIDIAVDKLLQTKIERNENVEWLLGKAAIASTKLTYQRFLSLFEGERFAALRAKGARVQRPLWASTSVKNPSYPDLMYVEPLVGRRTVNTVPPNTLEAILDHAHVRPDTIGEDVDRARNVLEQLAAHQISLYDVTERLVADGVKSFADSFDTMLAAIGGKLEELRRDDPPRVAISVAAAQRGAVSAALDRLAQMEFLRKLWSHDPAPWSNSAEHDAVVRGALGWIDIAEATTGAAGELAEFAQLCAKRFDHVVVLGMGGSSLAPDVLLAAFGKRPGFPELHVLDSTDPLQIKALEDEIDLAKALFVVASKSGTTIEPDALLRYFFNRVQQTVGGRNAADHFVAITDPGTPLESQARDAKFLRVFTNAADIGGRYSALSYFGMLPAALAGIDIATLLDRALGQMHANAASIDPHDAPGTRLGAALGALAKTGRNKLTIVEHPAVRGFGAWIEQLVAESSGKNGAGIVPVAGEPLGPVTAYGDDRVFAYVGAGLPDDPGAAALAQLEQAGHPVIRLTMSDPLDLGEQLYLWEIATAAACAVLGVDAFDQPNVQEAKDNTRRLLAEYAERSALPEHGARVNAGDVRIFALAGSSSLALGNDLQHALAALAHTVKPGDYVAVNAFVPRDAHNAALLRAMRTTLRDALRVATTVGFGPRFLHSTGQLHKGGPDQGVFLELTYDAPFELAIPGMPGFRVLERAQALGDFEALDRRGRRGLRVHLGSDVRAGLRDLAAALDAAVSARA